MTALLMTRRRFSLRLTPSPTRGGTLLFPPGNYLVTSVGLRPGVHYLGYGATITRPANQGKWVRSFDAAKQGYLYSGDEDSAMLTIEGLTFDGQRVTQDEYQKYQLEHAHLLFLQADPEQAGRLRARIVNCQFQDCVADAISLYTNVDVQIMNCTARDCFRGGITITGGHSRIQVVNFTAHGKVHPTGIDVEVDGAGFGGSYKIELTLNGLMLPDGDFDVAVFDGSVVLGNKHRNALPSIFTPAMRVSGSVTPSSALVATRVVKIGLFIRATSHFKTADFTLMVNPAMRLPRGLPFTFIGISVRASSR